MGFGDGGVEEEGGDWAGAVFDVYEFIVLGDILSSTY